MGDPDSISSAVYQDLIQLTFLCGRGLPLGDLMARFLDQVRPAIPARAVWLVAHGEVVARSGANDELPPVPEPRPIPAPTIGGDGTIAAFVAPAVTLACSPTGANPQRARDVMAMFARMIALAWQAEAVAREHDPPDDFHAARASFEKRWLVRLLQRHAGNVSEAARAAGLSRVYLYEMMKRYEVRPDTARIRP